MKKTILLASAAFAALTTPAFAQQTPQADGAVADEGEIIVTATRREQQLSDVPIAVSAVTGETLSNTGASDVRALNQVAPSLLVSGATSEVNFTARIRGIGTVGENAGLESSVGLFIDGVYRSRTGVGLSELGDIERIEVLRGPQGTLFGRNSTAGLINIVTKGPSDEFGGKLSATYGNYDYVRLDGGITGPIAEGLSARIDGVWQQRDGFIKNATPGEEDVNNRDRYLVRGQLRYEPSSDFSFRLIGDYSKRNELCCAAAIRTPRGLTRNPDGSVATGTNSLFNLLNALGANYQIGTGILERSTSTTPGFNYVSNSKDWGVSGEANWNLGPARLTSITAYRDYKNRMGQDGDFTRLDILHRTALDRRFRTFTQELRLQGDAFEGRLDWLVGGYFANEKLTVSDDIKYGADYERVANCLAVAGSALAPTLNLASPTCSNAPAGVFPGYQGLATLFGVNRLNGTGAVRSAFQQDSRNYAFFTHNVFDIIEDKLTLTLGARYTNERKDLTAQFNANNNLCGALRNAASSLASLACVINGTAPAAGFTSASPNRRKSEDQITGTGVLSFKPVDDVLVYASFSKGYKAGGYNLDASALDAPCNPAAGTVAQQTACAAALARPAETPGNARAELGDLQFAPEKVDAYEFGIKYNGRGFDVNVALFDQHYSNYQLNTYNGVNFEVTNIQSCRDSLAGADSDASAATGSCASNRLTSGVRARGFELEMFARPVRNLAFNAGLTYSDTYYKKNLVGTNGRALSPVLFQLPGQQVSNAPKYVVTTGASWTPEIGTSGLSALVYLDMRYQSDTNTGSDLDLEKMQDGFATVNGRVGIYGADKRWGIEFWGQNLFNTKAFQIGADAPLQGSGTYRSVAAPASSGFGGTATQLFVLFPNEPRTYGVTVKYNF